MESVIQTFKENGVKARNILLSAIPKIAAMDWTRILEDHRVSLVTAE